ncbi:MAG: hypothetical protein Q7U57_09630 [Methylovulum sp.]|nr:hypothetical protein [Methylovulum sp.]
MTTMTQSEFAKHLGVARSYITELKAKGHLVMTDDGLVDAEASISRMAALKDPAKQAVADRHQAERQKKHSDGQEKPETSGTSGNLYQVSRATKEKFNALAAKRDYELSIGKLMESDTVLQIVANAATILRSRLETLPDVLAPQLAAQTDEQKIRLLLQDYLEELLKETSQQFMKLSQA